MTTLKEKKESFERYINEELAQEAEAIQQISEQLQQLLEETKENQVEFAVLNANLKHFVEDLKDLSSIIKGDAKEISLLTKIALLTKSIEDIEEWIEQEKEKEKEKLKSDKKDSSAVAVAEKTGRWQLMTATVTGTLGLIASIITIIVNFYKH